jgi:hypothetical protein
MLSQVRRRTRAGPLLVEELEPRRTPSASGSVPANIAVTTDPGVQQMPSVAVDPHDPNHLVAAYLDYSLLTTGYAGIGVAVSNNGGTTWQHTSVPLPAGFDQGTATPIAQFDTQGHVFVSFAAVTFLGPLPPLVDPGGGAPRALGFKSDNGIFVARSDDGGLTWNTPVAVASHLYDGTNPVPFEIKPDLAIDTFQTLPNGQPNPLDGDLYEVWSRYYPAGQFPNEPTATGGSQILLAVSHDAGRTWQIESQPVAVVTDVLASNTGQGLAPGTGFENWSQVAIGPEGDIYVVQGTSAVSLYHSTDGGASFSQPNIPTGASYPFGTSLNGIPGLTLTNDQFRTQTIHNIAVDPTRPGHVYVVISTQITDSNGNPVDPGDILFARSTDYGVTWQTTFRVGPYQGASVLNDDNNGTSSTGAPDDVADGQALPRLATDAQGDIGVIWYDTRRDPSDTLLDVYGTISTDGGQTFSPNFRVTDQAFNPNDGAFTAANGSTSYYLGDALGLALANGTAYAAWTDTANGNQDVYFASFPINPPPPPPSNRFSPNATAGTATDLGKVVTRTLPKLTIAAGEEDWFQLRAAATGNLTVTATLAAPADGVRLQLYGAGGTTLLASGGAVLNADGQVVGQSITFPGQWGQTYLVRVLPGPAATTDTPVVYTLDMQSLTADLGTHVYGVKSSSLPAGQDAYYALSVPASGSLDVTLTPGTNAQGNFQVQLLDTSNLSVLASGQAAGAAQQASLALTQGQAVYLHVFGDATAQGDFSLAFINPDQFTTPNNQTLFFPTGGDPSQVAVADVNDDGKPDVVVDYADPDFVSVLLNNGDGTFQAPRDYAVGAFQAGNNSALGGLPDDKREMVIADFNGDGIPDIAVLNYQSDDVSLLLGRGDGTFEPQRVIGLGSLADPFALAAGDLNNDGIPDLVVASSTGGPAQPGEVLLGRGDGTFEPPIPFAIPSDPGFPTNAVQIADLNHDGKNDLVYEGYQTYVLLGNGDGSFGPATSIGFGVQGGIAVADLNGDGNPDIITAAPEFLANGAVEYALGNGDGSFQPQGSVLPGQAPIAVAVVDLGSQVTLPDGSTVLGPPDGIPDLVVANNGIVGNFSSGPPDVVLVPGLADAQGHFAGFGSPFVLAAANSPLDLKIADLTGDGITDVVVAEKGGIEIVYGKPLALPTNTTPATARNLGTVVHLVEPTQTIVPGHQDAYYTLTVPTEAARGAGDEILDFSGRFQGLNGAGVSMELTDAAGNLLGSGERFRVVVPQGAQLTLHFFGVPAADGSRGTGAYTLDIDTLPQLVSVEAQPLLPGQGAAPGGPTASLVLTFQGDRLDPTAAAEPANFTVTWLGPDGLPGTADDRVIPVDTTQGVVYDPSTNVDVASGTVYPTAVRQTVTLVFDQPLPPGSYRIDVANAVQAAAFNHQEAGLPTSAPGFTGHPVASVDAGQVTEGSQLTATDLVFAGGPLGDLGAFQAGTPFLTQLHDDLGALLNAGLTQLGDDPTISKTLDAQVLDRFASALGPAAARPVAVLVIWLDPPTIGLVDPSGQRVIYNPQNNSYRNTFRQGFVSVAGNVEVLVLPFTPIGAQDYRLSVAGVSPSARGGAVYLGRDGGSTEPLTAALRDGTTQFDFAFGVATVSVVSPSALASSPATASALPSASPAASALRGAVGPDLSPAAAVIAVGTRQGTALVIAIAPRTDPQALAGTLAQGPTSAPTTANDLAAAVALSGGAPDAPPESMEAFVGRLWSLLQRLGRPFLGVAAQLRSVLDGVVAGARNVLTAPDARAPVGDNRPALPAPGNEPVPPDEFDDQAEPLFPEAEGAESAVPPPPDAGASAFSGSALLAAGVGAAWREARRRGAGVHRKRQARNEDQTHA